MTRGQRKHNPLNIRRARGTRWLGQEKTQRDREFVQFTCDLMGYRAALRILRTYIKLYNLTSLRAIIYRWAPPEDGNHTTQYINMVSDTSGIEKADVLDFDDEDQMVKLVAGMARVESGIKSPDMHILHEAYRLAK